MAIPASIPRHLVVKPGKTSGITTALIYTRVSSDEQAREGLSLPAQLDSTRRYAAERGWSLGAEFTDVMSGRRDDPPQYQAMLAEVRRLRSEGRSVAVVVTALDRFGRKLLERVRARDELKGLGVEVHSLREGLVSDLVAGILASVAEEESARLGRRVAEVRAHVQSNGWYWPGRPAWGYRLRTATEQERRQGAPKSVLEPDPAAAPFVVEAMERIVQGQSRRSVARWAASLPSDARGGRVMNFTALGVLRSAVYIARPPRGDDDPLSRPAGHWEPLVDDVLWVQVQERLGRHRKMPNQASGRYLLTGLVRCHRCGARMYGDLARNGTTRYRCGSYCQGATDGGCSTTIHGPSLEGSALGQVATLLEDVASNDPVTQSAIRASWNHLSEGGGSGRTQHLKAAEAAKSKAQARIKKAALLLVDGILDRAGYDLARSQAEADLEAAERELARLGGEQIAPKLPPIETVLREAGSWSRMLTDGSIPAQRDVLAVLIEKIIPERLSYAKWAARITWTPLGEALRHLAEPTR